jgi:hypothetical protein
VAEPKTTKVIDAVISAPAELPPGVYLLPAAVKPTLPPSPGSVHIQESIVALLTIKVPGVIDAHVAPSFLGPAQRSGVAPAHHLPGFAPIQLATSGSEVLRVLDNSNVSFYASNEITATQTPFGTVVFKNHTAGISGDLRNPPVLYFPRTYREFPLSWHSSFLGIGAAHLNAYVGFQPNPNELVHVGVSTGALVVSPLWILVLALVLLFVLLGSDRLARRQVGRDEDEVKHRTGWGRVLRVVGSAVMVAIIAAAAFLAIPAAFFGVGAVGLALGIVNVVMRRREDRATAARRLRWYEGATLVLLLAGTVAVVLSGLSLWPGDFAVGILAGSGVWVLVTWWTLWWNQDRALTGKTDPESTDPSAGPAEPVAVGA